MVRALCKVRTLLDFPPPVGPTTMSPWRTPAWDHDDASDAGRRVRADHLVELNVLLDEDGHGLEALLVDGVLQ